MTMFDDAPESLRPLIDLLAENGFQAIADEQGPFIFGDRRFRWTRWDINIQVSLDRGRWFVDVVPSGRDDWFGYGLEIVFDTLDDVDHFTKLLTLRESTEILRNRLGEIAELVSSPDGQVAIEAMNHERAQRWFGA
jgi:hypothetical protein